MDNERKKYISIIVVSIIGIVLGFFGVIVSVYSDGSTYERAVTIGIVLIIYAILSLIVGLIKPIKTWIYMIALSLPGVLMLIVYSSIKEFKVLHIIYIVLILIISYFGTKTGKSFRIKK